MSSRFSVIPSVVPVLVLLLALGGQVKEPLATFALLGGALLVPWTSGLLVGIVVQLVRRASYASLAVGLLLALVAAGSLLALVLTAPLWVRWRAEPAVRAIERSRAESGHYPAVGSFDGDFPSSLRATLDTSGHCLYKPEGAGYHLACLGVPFSKCGYDGPSGRWTGWE